jgi:hypothetical protein
MTPRTEGDKMKNKMNIQMIVVLGKRGKILQNVMISF